MATAFSVLAILLVSASFASAQSLEKSTPDDNAALDDHGSDKPRFSPEQWLDELQTEGHAAVGLAKAKAFGRYTPYLPASEVITLLESAAANTPSAQVKFELKRQAAAAHLNIGDFGRSQDALSGQGCLVDFQIVGPFENASMQGFHARLGPEKGQKGPYKGKMTQIDWREQPNFDQFCVFDLDRNIEPSTAAAVYLASEIEVKRGGSAKLLLGASGAYKVWLNGQPIARRSEDLGLGVDADAWSINLQKGSNQLLIKLASTGAGNLGLAARLVDPNFAPIADATFKGAWNGEAVAKTTDDEDATKWPTPSEQSILAQAKNLSKKTNADAIWAAWLWSRLEPQNPATPWRDTALRIREFAAQNSGAISAQELALAADLVEEHWRKIDLLEMAHDTNPNDAWTSLHLASQYGASEAVKIQQKERTILEKVHLQVPNFLPGTLALSQWYAGNGFDKEAFRIMEDIAQEDETSISEIPRYISQLAYLTSVSGERDRADKLYRKLESIAALRTGYAWIRASDLIAENKNDEAFKIIDAQQKIAPWQLSWPVRKIELLRAENKLDEAQDMLDKLIAQRPGNVALYQKKADILLALNQKKKAAETIELALVQRPQDEDLRKLRAFLTPTSNQFFEPWIVDNIPELASDTPKSAYNYDTIVDQTLVHVAPNGLASTVVQRAERVLNDQGVDAASYQSISYTRGDEVVEVLGVRVHKPDGSISEDWDQWQSGGARKGSTTYNDSTSIKIRANNVKPGDIVEYRWRVSQVANENFRGDYFGDINFVQGTKPAALGRYVVHYPKSWELYFREPSLEHKRLTGLPDDSTLQPDYQIKGFELRDIPEVHTDRSQPGYTDVYDYVMVSNKKNYDEIGKWWWNLVEEQLIVDENIAAKVAELTQGMATDLQKVQAIHNYVVQNTRYLHVGLGIHGWKPYRTTTAYRNRYGDCKDKAALLKVMLDQAGVPAKLVLVRTRRLGHVDASPASMHIFNHAIAYVPSMDLFLDGTAEYNGTHELTPMDQGAQALIVSDGGDAKFMSMPIDKPVNNLIEKSMTVDFSGDTPVARGTVIAHGQNAAYYRQSLEDSQRRDEIFEKQLADLYPGAKLRQTTYSDLENLEQPVEISFEFTGGELLRETSARKFIFAYGAPKDLLSAYAGQATRHQDLNIRLPFINRTTMRYKLGPEQRFEAPPKDTVIKNQFGLVSVKYQREGNTLTVDIQYGISVQRVSREDYPKFRNFMAQMTATLNETVALSGTAKKDK